MLEASVLPPELLTASVSQVLPYVFGIGDVYSNYCFGPLFALKSTEMEDNQQEKGQKSFCSIRNPRNADTARPRAPIQPSPTLDGEWCQQYLETTVGAWPKNWLCTTLSHCARPPWFSSCYVFPSPRGRLVKKPFVWHSVFKSKLW